MNNIFYDIERILRQHNVIPLDPASRLHLISYPFYFNQIIIVSFSFHIPCLCFVHFTENPFIHLKVKYRLTKL